MPIDKKSLGRVYQPRTDRDGAFLWRTGRSETERARGTENGTRHLPIILQYPDWNRLLFGFLN